MFKNKRINKLAIDNIKINSLAQVAKNKSSNIAINISAPKIFHALFAFHYKFDIENPNWVSRDRFILCNSDANPTYYSILYLLGLINKNEIENINKPNCQYSNFLKRNDKLGIEISSYKHGYGIAEAVGIAIAQSYLSANFKEISHYTYVYVSNKDLESGVAIEALQYAGSINLRKFIVLHDSNSLLSSYNENNFFNNKKTYESYGFKYIKVNNNDYKSISKAISKAKKSNKPVFIEIKTSLGELSINNTENYDLKTSLLTFDQIDDFKEKTNFKKGDFFDTYLEVVDEYKKVFVKNNNIFKKWTPSDKLINFLNEELKENVNDNFLSNTSDIDSNLFTIISNIFDKYKNTFALSSFISTLIKVKNSNGVHEFNNRNGRSLLLGMKKTAMGLIANGLYNHSNMKPFVFNSLSYAEALIPSIKKAVSDNSKILYILNNDLNTLAQSNSSFQEEDQISLLSQIEKLKILYPADLNELTGAIEYFLNKSNSPVVIILNFISNWNCEQTSKHKFISGSYFLLKGNSECTLLAKGSDLQLAYKIAKKYDLNLISISNDENLEKLSYNKKLAITFTKDIKDGWMKYARYNLNINNSNNKFKSDFNYIEKAIKSIMNKKS
ncbi:transketolase family protein [Metamycoplasma gateae]|uniref:Transketolase n=1 Tax=Metamycoplasma gateae TaxID=35769 RepID=A0ABZ2ALC9_9BACT|nr:transketolase [Metamycoplasma gateae]